MDNEIITIPLHQMLTVDMSGGQVTSAPIEEPVLMEPLPKLTVDEDTFCLAVLEFGGNLIKAYRAVFGEEVTFPGAKARDMLARPEIAVRVKQLTDAVGEAALISAGAHLQELARLRDLSVAMGDMPTAVKAERFRGEAVGIYQKHDKGNGKGNNTAVQINIQMASKHDENI